MILKCHQSFNLQKHRKDFTFLGRHNPEVCSLGKSEWNNALWTL